MIDIHHKAMISLLVGGLLLPAAAFAKCDKEDVAFYLDKGFTQEQVTQLCTASEAEVPDYKPYQQQVIIYSSEEGLGGPDIKDGFTRQERQAIRHLQQGADVFGLTVDQDAIRYSVRVCLAAQVSKEYSQRFETCPEVSYDIARNGLEVVATGKKFFFFGQRAIQVTGDIKRQSRVNFDDYPAQYRKQLKRAYDWKANKKIAHIPIRGDFSATTIRNALRNLAKQADEDVTLARRNEGEGESEGAAGDAEKEEKPKKKRWWNPFD